MSGCHKAQVAEQNDAEKLFQQLKGVLNRLGTVLGQPHDHLLEKEHVTELDADPGLAAGLDRIDAQQSAGGETQMSHQDGPGGQSGYREQKSYTVNPVSMYQRVRGIRGEEERLIWRTRTTYPGYKGCAWLSFESEADAAQASDVVLMRFALTHQHKFTELVGQLNFTLGHYISYGTAEEEDLAVVLLDFLLRLPRLSAKNRQRVVDAYAALRAKRDAARRRGCAAGHPNLCNVVHPENGVAGRLAQLSAQQESDHSSGTSDLPEGVVGAAEGPRGTEPDTGQQAPAPSLNGDGATPRDASLSPSMSGDGHTFSEQHAHAEGGGPSGAGLEADRDPDAGTSGSVHHGMGAAEHGTRRHSSDGTPSAAEPLPVAEDNVTLPESLARAADEAAAMQSNQQSSYQPQRAAAVPIDGISPPPPPPPSASLLDDSPLCPPPNAMPEPYDAGSQREEEGIDDADFKDAAPDVPPEPSESSRQPSPSRHWSTSSASATTSSSNNSELPANEAEGQATSGSQLPSTWGARNGHVRGGRGKGTEADPVVLSSDSEDEQEDEEQGAKRARTEMAPAPGFVKPEILIEPPSLAELLHQYRDQQRLGGQGRPGSLHRPSMPLFESLRRPAPEVSGNGTARSGAPGSAGMRYGLPAWARVRPYSAGPQTPIPGLQPEATQMPRYASQQPRASPATPVMPNRPFGAPGLHPQPPAAAPFLGEPFSAIRQPPAGPSAQQVWTAQGPQSGAPAQQSPQGEAAWKGWPRQAPGAAQGQPRIVEFIDLDSSSGDSEGVSWHEDDTADAESELADGAEYSSAQAHEQPTSSEAAHAAAGQEQGSVETPPPMAPAPETDDTSGLVIERDRTATAAVEAEEWELRRVEIERQAEQARREKKRRRAESELALRSQARLEDHRRLLAAQECEADERERLRMEVRAALELRVRFARSAESRLRALHIPMEYDTVTNLPNISKAVRRALLFYHPDRYQNEGLRAQVEAEEMFKLVSRVQNP